MLSRSVSTTTTFSGRASAMRRLRRRSLDAERALLCNTNGCATLLRLDPVARLATCPICGYRRRLD